MELFPRNPRNKMALVTRLQNSQASQEATNDITRNLLSLQFESALNDEERELLVLRARSHAISVTQCALSTVMVDIFKKTRWISQSQPNVVFFKVLFLLKIFPTDLDLIYILYYITFWFFFHCCEVSFDLDISVNLFVLVSLFVLHKAEGL